MEFQGFYGNETKRGCLRCNVSHNDVTELNLQGSINIRARSGQNSIELTVENWLNWWPSDTASTRLMFESVYNVESVLGDILFLISSYKQVTYEFTFRLSQNEANETSTKCFEFLTFERKPFKAIPARFQYLKNFITNFFKFSFKQA